MKMRSLKPRTNGDAINSTKRGILAIALTCICIPWLILIWSDYSVTPALYSFLTRLLFAGFYLLLGFLVTMILISQYSPIKLLALRKKIILFTRDFVKSIDDGTRFHSVQWEYDITGKKISVNLYPKGLVQDTAVLGKKLSEYLGEAMLEYEELDGKTRYVFGQYPNRYDGIELMKNGISSHKNDKKIIAHYNPIPIYDDIFWYIASEAIHILLIAPSGAGKTMFLFYLIGMLLKQKHLVYVVDAKNSAFGRFCRHVGLPVAINTAEVIRMLNALVEEMQEIYTTHFANSEASVDADFSTLPIKGHFLIFDEVLSVLSSANKKEKAEIEYLLGQLALLGRAAGFGIIVSAQKLNATDLSKNITEQCQTRIILGRIVSDETFHQATGLYKKDLGHAYRGGVGKGYAVTPQTGIKYIETPLMPHNVRDYMVLMKELRDWGTPYGEGR